MTRGGLAAHRGFDAVVVSCEIGLRKPDPAMYEFVTNALGVAPGSTVLLDDLEGNIDERGGRGGTRSWLVLTMPRPSPLSTTSCQPRA